MAGEWRMATIGDVAERVAMGPFGSSIKVETFVPSGVPVISGQHLHDFKVDGRTGFNFVTEEHADRLKNANVQRGDVIFTHAGNIGQVAYVPEDSQFQRYVISQRQFYMRCDRSKILPEFAVAYFKSHEGQHKLLANSSQVGVPSIAQPVTYLRTIEIPVPPLSEQHAIAHILGTLDDKIELNRRMNETLEALAHALFNKFFPYAPDDELPKGWHTVSVGDEVCLTKGVSYRSEELASSHTALVTLKSINRGGGYHRDGLKSYIGEFEPDQVIEPGELVIAYTDVTQAAEVIGKPALVLPDERFKTLVASLDLTIARPIAGDLSQYFFYLLFRSLDFQAHVYGYTNGTTVLHLSKTGVPSYRFARPPRPVAEAFTAIVRPIFERLAANEIESRTLAALRDALLPKLISGEIRIQQLETFQVGQ